MNNRVSEEILEIGGKEYTLFLNREGISTWERKTKLKQKAKEFQELETKLDEEDIEITDETNPFEMYDDNETLSDSLIAMEEMYITLYWIMLYTHHKLSFNQVKELFFQAEEEYGVEQLFLLGNQMVENANKNLAGKQTKKLKALKSNN